MLYVAALGLAFLLMHFIRSLVEEDSRAAASRQPSHTDAALVKHSSRTIALDRMSAVTRSLSAPEAATQHLLEQAVALAAQEQAQGSTPHGHCADPTAAGLPQPSSAGTEASVGGSGLRSAQAAAGPMLMEFTLQQALAAGLVALMPVDGAGAAAVGPQQLVTFEQAAAAGVVLTGPLYIAQPMGGATPAVGFVLVPAGNSGATQPQLQQVMPAAALRPLRLHEQQPAISQDPSMAQAAAMAGLGVAAPGVGGASTEGLSLEEAAMAAGLLRR